MQASGLLGSPSKSVGADPVVRERFRARHSWNPAELSIDCLEESILVGADDFHQLSVQANIRARLAASKATHVWRGLHGYDVLTSV